MEKEEEEGIRPVKDKQDKDQKCGRGRKKRRRGRNQEKRRNYRRKDWGQRRAVSRRGLKNRHA